MTELDTKYYLRHVQTLRIWAEILEAAIPTKLSTDQPGAKLLPQDIDAVVGRTFIGPSEDPDFQMKYLAVFNVGNRYALLRAYRVSGTEVKSRLYWADYLHVLLDYMTPDEQKDCDV